MNIVAITQARYGSSRLPGKVLKKIGEISLLQMHLERASKSQKISKLIVATTFENEADAIADLSTSLGFNVFRGSTEDVLDRYYQAARSEKADYIVRITSDCPLIDPKLIDDVVQTCLDEGLDYCSNGLDPTFPDGFDVEVFKFSALEKAWFEADLKSEREHVSTYIWKNSTYFGKDKFTSTNFKGDGNFSNFRLTVDEQTDFDLILATVQSIGFDKGWRDYVNFLQQNPEVFQINSSIKRNEGLMKSLQEDKKVTIRRITNFTKSDQYRSKIHGLIPGGAHTYSKGDDQFPERAPAAIVSGKGAYVWDLDDNKYLDCSMGLTSVSLGHAYGAVLDRVKSEIDKGVNFQRPSYLEMEMAEKFLSLVPQHQMIKFGKNGSLVITAAIKLARAFTGRKMVAFPHDHSFYSYDDWFIGTTPCDAGIPEENKNLSLRFKSCDLDSLQKLFDEHPNEIACVVTEPEKNHCGTTCNCSISVGEYLKKAIDLCHKHGALFIQDEMVTGFKTHFPGSITKYDTDPDMATWGKGIANGFSFCALTGKKEVMELGGIKNHGQEKVFLISTTHGGETSAIAAGLATIKVFEDHDVLNYNLQNGRYFIQLLRAMVVSNQLSEYVEITPCDWVPLFTFKNAKHEVCSGMRTLMMQEMIGRGVLFQGAFVPCFSHTKQDIDFFGECFNDSLQIYKQALEKGYQGLLIGEPAKPVFRKYL